MPDRHTISTQAKATYIWPNCKAALRAAQIAGVLRYSYTPMAADNMTGLATRARIMPSRTIQALNKTIGRLCCAIPMLQSVD